MNGENITCKLLIGSELNYILFKTAIYFAEIGLQVWYISPEYFETIPANINAPDKEVLQLITFLYLKNYKDLIMHLNGIHTWHKSPNMIILSGFDIYTNLFSDNYNSLVSALVATSLLDSISTCAKKKSTKTNLLVACTKPPQVYESRLKVVRDLYFQHYIEKENCDDFLSVIVSSFNNKP